MIAIVNISKEPKAIGWQDYEIRINSTVVATFRHKREEGLAKCLQEAAKAVDNELTKSLKILLRQGK